MVSGTEIAIVSAMLAVILINMQFTLICIKDALNRIARALEKQNHEEDTP